MHSLCVSDANNYAHNIIGAYDIANLCRVRARTKRAWICVSCVRSIDIDPIDRGEQAFHSANVWN